MRLLIAVLAVLLASGCFSGRDPMRSPSLADDCAIIVSVAQAQYNWAHPFPISREGYLPPCDWTAAGLDVRIVDRPEFADFSGWARLRRPVYWGRRANIYISYFNGIHLIQRRCNLTREVDGWRLDGDCSITDWL